MNIKSILGKAKGFKYFHRLVPPSLREVLSEDGIGSYSRVSGFMVICASLLWVSFLVVRNHNFPDMGGVTEFITAGNSAYAANQVKRVIAASKTGSPKGDVDPKGDTDASAA